MPLDSPAPTRTPALIGPWWTAPWLRWFTQVYRVLQLVTEEPGSIAGYLIEQSLTDATTELQWTGGAVSAGARLSVVITQDATGGRLVTWRAADFQGAPLNINMGPNEVTTLSFVRRLNGLWRWVDQWEPAGTYKPYGGATAPVGYLLCYGQAVSRTTYATLFAALGVAFGPGNGATTFNLPDLRGRMPLGKDNMGGVSANRVTAAEADNIGQSSGAESHTLVEAELPAHTHGAGTLSVDDPGGHTHGAGTLTTDDPGNHSHTYVGPNTTAAGGAGVNAGALGTSTTAAGAHTHAISGATGADGGHTHTLSGAIGSAGGGGAHNNMPPYLTGNYIVKT